MAKSLEDVLLNITHVKNKKCDGTLYLLTERLAWMPSGKDSFTISYNYSDIKVQKISPDKKEKIQLQIVLHSSGASTFHFNNPGGRSAQLKDRESVKDLLQQMLVKFKRKINGDLEEKHKMLQEDPELFQMYKNLVVGNVLTPEEFWSDRLKSNKLIDSSAQNIGVSAGFLADIQGTAEGCNGIRYNLTPDVIDNIFKTYPAVEQKHLEYVPDKLTEQEFWYEFFQSHYFHRDRINISDKELFADCAKNDEKILRSEIETEKSGNRMDLQSLIETSSDEYYGEDYFPEKEPGSISSANISLIRRFNQHSTLVLKSIDTPQNSSNNNNKSSDVLGVAVEKKVTRDINNVDGVVERSNGKKNGTKRASPSSSSSVASELELLTGNIDDDVIGSRDVNVTSMTSLNLTRVDAYMHGPVPEMALTYNTSDELLAAAQAFHNDVISWKCNAAHQILPSNAGLNVLSELAPTGVLMQDSLGQQIDGIVPNDSKHELKSMYMALSELLRHFWSCFPVTSRELDEKAARMDECLRKFQQTKLAPFSEKLQTHQPDIDLTSHMNTMIEKAHTRFSTWQAKKLSRKPNI
ncbi:hypothetical protein HELRODRAFT_102185 [Helobdella robusta]|uniref:General transcription factor IIH subunit 1 n=1 Tax=Helobdella robusta TaxID=6412 RepID=T1ED87_HELRO|nr:hypothetical protein HELRODRAFT_102185 [Helobdella robusta]ESN97259.1 hypothetical protein HELRODRAFT_102185 [Helobdella robusta]